MNECSFIALVVCTLTEILISILMLNIVPKIFVNPPPFCIETYFATYSLCICNYFVVKFRIMCHGGLERKAHNSLLWAYYQPSFLDFHAFFCLQPLEKLYGLVHWFKFFQLEIYLNKGIFDYTLPFLLNKSPNFVSQLAKFYFQLLCIWITLIQMAPMT